jgi:rubrerythrin/rhodanese-related sulfurtransferase
MDNLEFETLTADEFREYLESQKEIDYLVIDVRQESEYELAHIPGARLIPLAEVESRLFSLPTDRDLIFYCHNGGRSQWAASLAGEGEISQKAVYHLMGGLLAWDGITLSGYPKIQLFEKIEEPVNLLRTAMDLEKGAWRFYRYAIEKFNGDPIGQILDQLSIAEMGHAKLIYRFLQKIETDPLPFDDYHNGLAGEIMEGGLSFEEACDRLETLEKQSCTGIIDLALEIEYAAFDLCRAVAERTDDSEVRETFLAIAQAEKGHMRILARSIAKCL